MPARISSKGKCAYCEKVFSRSALSNHLNAHLAKKITTGKLGKSFHLKIETNPRWGISPYFLHLWADGNATLQKLDTLLRGIWLECCGHMSEFRAPHQKRPSMTNFLQSLRKGNMMTGFESESGEIPMKKKAGTLFYKDLKLEYQYDFGSTTELQLTVIEEFAVAADQPLVLLARNERPEWMCGMCGVKAATQLCTVCDDENIFCAACAKKHARKCDDFADYAAMPVVNSPRMGVCDYRGGSIDIERD